MGNSCCAASINANEFDWKNKQVSSPLRLKKEEKEEKEE